MLDERKTAILRAVVREYIETAQPVGSTHVAKSSGINVSSATVRNEMAVLEQEGYLAQPHTSAGRIPTDKGYRVFVDALAHGGRLDAMRAQQVRSFFDASHTAIERMLADTSRLLSDLTDYAAVVVGPPPEVASVRSVQLVSLSPRLVTVVAVLSSGSVDHHRLELDEDLSEDTVAVASGALARIAVGSTLPDLSVPQPTGNPSVDALVASALMALSGPGAQEATDVFVGGASRMAVAFDAVDIVRQVLLTLEQQYVVVGLVRDVLDRGLSVAIGTEHGVEPLAACSVVVAPYIVEGEHVGSVGVLGPTRMNYPHALAAVEMVSEKLGRRLTEG
ncbi:MAG: Heat-inducible transcription repressor HrcA [Acidimicrobiia bacterium]|nr:Heat-inducible transcription repressor HrcA [Acidimicrobiia bacterium]